MNTDYRLRLIAGAALVLLSVALAQVATVSAKPPGSDGDAIFPDVKDSWSPDARFVLKNVDHPEDPSSPHSIYLTDMQTGARTLLYSYPRKVDVLWSPSSDALAINDWDSNDQAQCVVLTLTPRLERFDISEESMKSSRADREKRVATDLHDDDHAYAHIIQWLDAKTLLLDVESRGPDGRRGDSHLLQKRIIH